MKFQLKSAKTIIFLLAAFAFQKVYAANFFWVGTFSNNWNSSNNWASSSGGAGGAGVPGVNDVARFDANGPVDCNINVNISVAGIDISGYPNTLSQGASTVTIGNSGYSQNSGTFSGGSVAFTINGTGLFSLSGGTFTSTSGTFTLTGTRSASQTVFTHSAGTFNHNNGTVLLSVSSGCTQFTHTLDLDASSQFYNFTIQSSTGCSPQIVTTAAGDILKVSNNLTHTDGLFNGTAEIQGNLTINSGADGGTGTITFNGTGAQTYSQASGTTRTSQIVINKSSGSVTPASSPMDFFCQSFTLQAGSFTAPSGTLNIGGTWNNGLTLFNHIAGTFTHNNGTVAINPGSPCTQYTFVVDVLNSTTFNNFTIQGTTGCTPVIITTGTSDVLDVAGNFTHTDGIFNGSANVQGNLVINAGGDGGTGTITFTGTANQTYSQASGATRTCQIAVNKTSGSVSPASSPMDFYCQSFTLQAGAFTAPSGTLNIGGTWTNGLTIFNHVAGTFSHNNGTVAINPGSPCTQYTFVVDVLNSTTFNNFTIQGTTGCTPVIITTGTSDILDVVGNFTHTDGIFNGSANIQGNLAINAGADGGTGTLTFTGSANQTYSQASGATRTCQIAVNKTSGSVTPASSPMDFYCQSFVLQAGDFTAPSGSFNIGGTWTGSVTIFNHIAGTFTHNNGTVEINPNSPCSQYTYTLDVLSSTVFYNFRVNATTGCTPGIVTTATGDVIEVANNFTHTDGIINGQFNFSGNLSIAATSDGGSGTITAKGSGFQEYTYSAGAARTCKLVVAKPSGVVSPATGTSALSCQSFTLSSGRFIAPTGNFNIGGTWNSNVTIFNHTGGSFDHNNGTVVIDPASPCSQYTFTLDIVPGTWFNSLTINGTTGCTPVIITTATGDVLYMANDITHNDGILNGDYHFNGNLSIGANADGGTATLTAQGSANQTYSQASGSTRTSQIIVDKSAGTFSQTGANNNFTVQSFSLISGTFIAPTGIFNIGGSWSANTTIFSHSGGTFNHNNGTVTFNPSSPCPLYTFTIDVLPATVFYNLNMTAQTGCTPPILAGGSGDTLDVQNNLNYTDGVCNATISVNGNATVASTFDGGTGKLIFLGSNNQTFDLTGATGLFDGAVLLAKTGGAVTLNSVFTMDAAGQSLSLQGGNINTTSTNLLRVDRTVSVIGGSASSFVNGPMLRMVAFNGATNGLFFPIGKNGAYRQAILNVTHNAATNFNYTAEVIPSSAPALTLPGSLDKVSPIRYWQIDRSATGNLTNASVQLFYGSDDGVADNTNLRIAQGSGGSWVNLGGTGTANGTGSITSTVNFTSFSPFALANNSGGGNFHAAALNFDGTDDYVVATGYSTMTAYTIEAWVKVNSTSNQNVIVASDGAGPTSNWTHQIRLNGGKFEHYTYDGSTHFVVGTTSVNTGQWYHVAITATNGGVAKLFINGTEEGTPQSIGTLWTPMNRFYMGSNSGFGMGYLNGELDQVRIWNFARTCSQIRADMNHELLGTETGLDAYYHFNQGVASANNSGVTTLNDIAGTAQNGTLTNFALSGSTSNWVAPGSGAAGTTTDPQPEINVKGNSNTIADGDITPATTDHTDFANVAVNTPFARTYTIENTGAGPLNISAITLTGTHAAMFSVGALTPAGPIGSGGSATVTVTFTPTSTGLKTATLNIASNDCDEATYDFSIQGTGITPGAALNFDGTDYVDCGSSSNLRVTGNQITLEAWVNPNTTNATQRIIFNKEGEYEWAITNGVIEYALANTTPGWVWVSTGVGVTPATWTYLALVYDGANVRLYKNGSLSFTSSSTSGNIGDVHTSADNFWIADRQALPGTYTFIGSIDEVRVWKRALCAQEIASQYACEISGTRTGLVANYHFNHGLAASNNAGVTSLTDFSGFSNTGTLTNFTLNGSTSNWISPGGVTSGVSCSSPCDSANSAATAVGTYTSTMAYTSPVSGFTHYCDCQGKLLLSLKLGGTGAVIPDNGVELKINSTGSSFYPQHVGFVGNTFGYAAMDRTWDVAVTSQPTSGQVDVRFYFNSADVSAVNSTLVGNGLPGISSYKDLTFWKVVNSTKPKHEAIANLTQWDVKIISYGPKPTDSTWKIGFRPVATDYFAQFKVPGFSGGGGGAGPLGLTPLPLNLLYINASPVENKYIHLKWATASENNSQIFEVQRSENGKNWETIGTTPAMGNTSLVTEYSYNDFAVIGNKLYYYRVVLVSLDASKEPSRVVAAKLNLLIPAVLNVYPNPADHTLQVNWPEGVETAIVKLMSADGKVLLEKSVDTIRDNRLDISAFPAGIYLLSVDMNGTVINNRIVIQHN